MVDKVRNYVYSYKVKEEIIQWWKLDIKEYSKFLLWMYFLSDLRNIYARLHLKMIVWRSKDMHFPQLNFRGFDERIRIRNDIFHRYLFNDKWLNYLGHF